MKVIRIPIICRAIYNGYMEVPDDYNLDDATDFFLLNEESVVPSNEMEYDGFLGSAYKLAEFVEYENLSEFDKARLKRTMELIKKGENYDLLE